MKMIMAFLFAILGIILFKQGDLLSGIILLIFSSHLYYSERP